MKLKKIKRITALIVSAVMCLSMAACGGNKDNKNNPDAGKVQEKKDTSVVNIGCTFTLGSLNPLVMDASWINTYAARMQFLPLVSLTDDLEFEYMLAKNISTEDNLTYTVELNPDAKWSDGRPVTAEDLEFTIMRLASPLVMNSTMQMAALAGTDDETGWIEEGAESMEALNVVDEHTLNITFKQEMNLVGFLNGYAQYFLTLPKHEIEKIPEAELAYSEWFNAPTVVSGPYAAKDHDANHYISFEANENYWKGKPNIKYCNFKIVSNSQLLSSMKSGEIDIIAPLLGSIPEADYEAMKTLGGVTTNYGIGITAEPLFINCEQIPDERVRQAMLYAIDRKTIVSGLLGGNADLMDGFCVPDGPFYSGQEAVSYDPKKAKELLKEAGWDGSEKYSIHIDSGNNTLVSAATLCQNYWAQVGIKVDIVTEDLDTLLANGGTEKTDILGVQYTYPPVDPSWDIDWVLPAWCHLYPDEIKDRVQKIWSSNDTKEQSEEYAAIDAWAKEQVPVITLYAHGPLGAVRDSLKNASASTYGFANNIQEWSFE